MVDGVGFTWSFNKKLYKAAINCNFKHIYKRYAHKG